MCVRLRMFPGRASLGYRNVTGPDGRKIIEPDPVKGPIVRALFEWYAEGRHSLSDSSAWCKRHGLVSPRTGKAIPRQTILKMLRNPIYYGDFVWQGQLYVGSFDAKSSGRGSMS